MNNLCIRCGKERIIVDEWDEETQTERRSSNIRHMRSVCPDPECQKKVERDIDKEREKNEERRKEKSEKDKSLQEERKRRMELVLSKANKKRK